MVAGPPRVCGRWRLTASSPIGSCIRGVPARGQPPTPRTSGCTGQGLCVLHEPPHFVEYTRTLPSSTRPSCSAGSRHGSAPQKLTARASTAICSVMASLSWRMRAASASLSAHSRTEA